MVTVSLDHPILFVADYANRQMVVPDYLPDKIASATSSCISIRTITYIDGDVKVNLSTDDIEAPAGYVEVFRGRVDTPSRRIAVIRSDNEKIAELDVAGVSTEIKVIVNQTIAPDVLLVHVV